MYLIYGLYKNIRGFKKNNFKSLLQNETIKSQNET